MTQQGKATQIGISISKELNTWLRARASKEGRSLSNYTAKKLEEIMETEIEIEKGDNHPFD